MSQPQTSVTLYSTVTGRLGPPDGALSLVQDVVGKSQAVQSAQGCGAEALSSGH